MSSEKEKDYFKDSIKTFCKRNNMSSRKTRFTKNDAHITISIKNHSENGLDIDSFKVLSLILNAIGSTKTKFIHQPFMFPNSQRIDRIDIYFEEKDYKNLINTLFNENV